jgi:hypothetical protein
MESLFFRQARPNEESSTVFGIGAKASRNLNLLDTQAFSLDPVLTFSHLKVIGQVRKLLLVHPLRTRTRFEPVAALVEVLSIGV